MAYTTHQQAAFELALNTAGQQLISAAKELNRLKNDLPDELYQKKLEFLNNMTLVMRTAAAMAEAMTKRERALMAEINRLKNDLPEQQPEASPHFMTFDQRRAHQTIQYRKWRDNF